MACPRIDSCPLFGCFTMKASALLWRSNYCEGDHQGCERVRLEGQGKRVPRNLLPNGRLLELAHPLPAPVAAPAPRRSAR